MSAVQTFTHASNISLLTQAIKFHSAPRCASSPHADHHRCQSSPHPRQCTRHSSRPTQDNPWSYPSPLHKRWVADLRTGTDLHATDSCFSSSTVLLLLDFLVPTHNDSPVGARLQLYWRNWQDFTDPWVISVLWDGYYVPFAANLPLTLDLPLPYSRSYPLIQELTSLVQALLAKGP